MSRTRSGRLAAPLVALALGVGGCGSDGDVGAIRQTIHAAVRAALVDRDPHRACAYGTATGRRRLLHWYGLSYARRFRSCEQVVRFEVRQQADAVVPRLRRNLGVIGRVRVDGSRATAQVTDHTGAYPAYVSVSLRRLAGRWLIEDSSAIPHGM